MSTIEVFRTTVIDMTSAQRITQEFKQRHPAWRVTFDLEDCDHVLRIEGYAICPQYVTEHLASAGYLCVSLE